MSLEYRAGSSSFPKGKDGIHVTFSKPMPNTQYAVSVQQTNTGGYSPTNGDTYFNVMRKTKDGFIVQHKTADGDQPVELEQSVTLNWIVVSFN